MTGPGAEPDAEPDEAVRLRALYRAVNGLRDEDPVHSAANAVVGWQRAV